MNEFINEQLYLLNERYNELLLSEEVFMPPAQTEFSQIIERYTELKQLKEQAK